MGLFQLDEKVSRERDTPKQFYSLGNSKLRIVTRLLSNGSHYHRPKTRFIIRKIACCSKSKPDPHHFAIFDTTVDDLLLRIRSAHLRSGPIYSNFSIARTSPTNRKESLRGHATQLSGDRVCCY